MFDRNAAAAEQVRVAKLEGFARTYAGNVLAVGIIRAARSDGRRPEDVAMELLDTCGAPVVQTDGWKAEWAGSEKLQSEFPTDGAYVAFKKDEQRKSVGQ